MLLTLSSSSSPNVSNTENPKSESEFLTRGFYLNLSKLGAILHSPLSLSLWDNPTHWDLVTLKIFIRRVVTTPAKARTTVIGSISKFRQCKRRLTSCRPFRGKRRSQDRVFRNNSSGNTPSLTVRRSLCTGAQLYYAAKDPPIRNPPAAERRVDTILGPKSRSSILAHFIIDVD
jgi:hypothetical protein